MSAQEPEGALSINRHLWQIEAELEEVVRSEHEAHAEYYGMMRYHLGWVDEDLRPVQASIGKRLRPLLCLLCCEATGGDTRAALPAAAAVELIHSFSLVHDDIQDRSRIRRGRRAVWDVWGTSHGINVGDGLFVLARLALLRLSERGVPAERQQVAVQALDRACLALCEGQFLDISFESREEVGLPEYLWMIQRKTAALLAASAQLGAIVASDDSVVTDACYHFGKDLGMAFQVQDDILGIWGDEHVTGKSAATDIRDRKKTLPVVYALQYADNPSEVRELAGLYAQAAPLDSSAIQRVLAVLDRVGARHYAERMSRQYARQALKHLEGLGLEDVGRARLHALASSLHSRKA